MLLGAEWGGHAELVGFSEIYYVPIQVFDSIRSDDQIITILITNGVIMIGILFLDEYYDGLNSV